MQLAMGPTKGGVDQAGDFLGGITDMFKDYNDLDLLAHDWNQFISDYMALSSKLEVGQTQQAWLVMDIMPPHRYRGLAETSSGFLTNNATDMLPITVFGITGPDSPYKFRIDADRFCANGKC